MGHRLERKYIRLEERSERNEGPSWRWNLRSQLASTNFRPGYPISYDNARPTAICLDRSRIFSVNTMLRIQSEMAEVFVEAVATSVTLLWQG
jgi:hypothetical protein